MTAARDDLAERGVRVKPLEWLASGRDSYETVGPERVHYRIWPTVTAGHNRYGLSGGTCGYFSATEAAKAAAQADYEARILAALEVTP